MTCDIIYTIVVAMIKNKYKRNIFYTTEIPELYIVYKTLLQWS